MTEMDLFNIVSAADTQIVALYSQFISISLAAVAGIYLFLNAANMVLKILAYAVYLIGSLMFIGLMLEESNIKRVALETLSALPRETLSPLTRGTMDLRSSWLFVDTAVLLNLGLWVLILATTYLMFLWRKDGPSARPAG